MQVKQPSGIVPLDYILPDEPLLMMGAGPVPIPKPVSNANAIVINHLGETMTQVIDQIKAMSAYVFQSETARIMGVAGPGSAAMEMAIVNLVSPGDHVLCVCNGFFSNRLAELSDRADANVLRLNINEGEAASLDAVQAAIIKHKPKLLTIVQGETSNTVFNHTLAQISELAHQHNCLVVVDAVCTLSTMPLEMAAWDIDAIITGGQKGLSSIPGVSLIAFSERAWDHILSRKDKLKHWCLDAKLADQFWHGKSYHYTAPVSGVLAIHEALRLVCEETLPARFHRHLRSSTALQAGIEGMGLSLYVEKKHRLNSVVGINVPPNVDAKQLLQTMSVDYRVEISGSFGPDIVRIGQMGEQSRAHNLFRTIHALGASLNSLGVSMDVPAGMSALESTLQWFDQSKTAEQSLTPQ